MDGPGAGAGRDSGRDGSGAPRRLACPFCGAYDVTRLYMASLRADACDCLTCGARWDEEAGTGALRGPHSSASVLIPRERP